MQSNLYIYSDAKGSQRCKQIFLIKNFNGEIHSDTFKSISVITAQQ